MLWQSINEACDVCQCSRLIKNAFQLTERYNSMDRGFNHHSNCTSAINYENEVDKENQHFGSPMKHDSDISLYGSSSPSSKCTSMMCSPSPSKFSSKLARQPLEEFDLNSQDSGYGTSFTDKETSLFHFVQPNSTAPRKPSEHSIGSPSKHQTSSSLFNSFSSVESMDDGFLELSWKADLEPIPAAESELPCNFNALLSGSLKNVTPVSHNSKQRPAFRRSVSLKEDGFNNATSRARHCLFDSSIPEMFNENRPFKRPEPPTELVSPVQSKRYKCASPMRTHPKVQRSFSATEESIMSALQRSSTDPDLIGDFSKPFCLPLISGRHQDLKSISASTVADLMKGQFDGSVASFKIIDCRYPYEFKGGHIGGALNFYTKDQILSELVESKRGLTPCVEPEGPKRHILVFHCEFSSERGPNLSRFLRNLDRTRNNDAYPALHYPELYLLDGGYKSFYEQYSELCEPIAYKPMLDPAHETDLRHFRAKSKTWNSDTRGRPHLRSTFKRLGFP